MPRNPQELVNFIARHYRQLAAMGRERARFTSDDEIAVFLQTHSQEEINTPRVIGQMKELGVLAEGAGDWSLPPFLARFLNEVQDRHTLASPQVIRGWVDKLEAQVRELERQIETTAIDLSLTECDTVAFFLREIADTFHTIAGTVQENCERITAEVTDYRNLEDARRMRSRLRRLVTLHDEYLEPVIRIIDISGDFHAVSSRISNCCSRLAILAGEDTGGIGEESRLIRQEVTWLRRATIRRAEEARRELGPLCEAAARESRIATGVNRAIEAIRLGQWRTLGLEQRLPIVEDKDGTLFRDSAVDQYLRLALQVRRSNPPRITSDNPDELEMPWTAPSLLEKLHEIRALDDLLAWIAQTCGDIRADQAANLLQNIIERESVRASASQDRREYELNNMVVDAARWTWGPDNGKR